MICQFEGAARITGNVCFISFFLLMGIHSHWVWLERQLWMGGRGAQLARVSSFKWLSEPAHKVHLTHRYLRALMLAVGLTWPPIMAHIHRLKLAVPHTLFNDTSVQSSIQGAVEVPMIHLHHGWLSEPFHSKCVCISVCQDENPTSPQSRVQLLMTYMFAGVIMGGLLWGIDMYWMITVVDCICIRTRVFKVF